MHDLIIVGGGTAGCVLAERLSASGQRRVLLIEAGGTPSSMFVRMPAGFAKLFKTKLDWAFESEPGAGTDGRRVFTPRGKMLGGSSNITPRFINGVTPRTLTAGLLPGWTAGDGRMSRRFSRRRKVGRNRQERASAGARARCW